MGFIQHSSLEAPVLDEPVDQLERRQQRGGENVPPPLSPFIWLRGPSLVAKQSQEVI
jgi:hypothetical protein